MTENEIAPSPVNPGDDETVLTYREYRLVVSSFGASLRGFYATSAGIEYEIVTGYHGAAGKTGGQGDVLIPYPGRVAEGRYEFDGNTYQLPLNDKEVAASIHGFLRLTTWNQETISDREIAFFTTISADEYKDRGYPFSLRVQVNYSLGDDGLVCAFKIENIGETAAPVAAGFHPYFKVGSDLIDSCTLQIPFASYLEFESLIPTGRVLPVAGTPLDFQQPHAIGEVKFNTCYLNPRPEDNGNIEVILHSEETDRAVLVWMDEAFNYVVVYSGDPLPESHRRKSLAIEPMTCGSDAFNHSEWGLRTLAPGATFSGKWGVTIYSGVGL